MHDRKKPRSNAGSRPPQVEPAQGAGERVLNQIVGAFAVAGERPRITPQRRHLLQDQGVGAAHAGAREACCANRFLMRNNTRFSGLFRLCRAAFGRSFCMVSMRPAPGSRVARAGAPSYCSGGRRARAERRPASQECVTRP